MVMDWQRSLPEAQGSVTTRTPQELELWRSDVFYSAGAQDYQIRVWVEWFDRCGNGSNTFYYHEEVVLAYTNRMSERISCGDTCAEPIVAAIPADIRALKKWSGCHPFGPWYYIENTLFHAGDRDCHGLLKGEKKQIINGRSGLPAWRLAAVDEQGNEVELYNLTKSIDSETQPPCNYRLEYRPWCRIGEGSERKLDYARSTAIWPDATDEQLMDENLATALRMRLPGLLVEFRKVIEDLGFVW